MILKNILFPGCPLDEVENRLKSIFTVQRKIRLCYDPLKIEETGAIDKEPSKDNNLEEWYTRFYPLNKEREKMLVSTKGKRDREANQKGMLTKEKHY